MVGTTHFREGPDVQLNTTTRSRVLSSAAAALIYLVIALATGASLGGALIGAVVVGIVAAVIGTVVHAVVVNRRGR